MAINPNIALAGRSLNLIDAVTGGYKAGEYIANRGVRDTLLDQSQQMNAQAIQQNQRQQAIQAGQYSVKLLESLKGVPMSERAGIVAQNLPLLESMGINYADVLGGGLDDNSLNSRVAALKPVLFSVEQTAESVGKIGTYNPRDYTESSFAEFVKGGMADPSVLERYFPLKETKIGGTTYFSDDAGQLYLPVSPDNPAQQATPEQVAAGEAVPSPQPVALTPEMQAQQEAKSKATVTKAVETARADVAADVAEVEQEAEFQKEYDKALQTVRLIDDILVSDRLDNITGLTGAFPYSFKGTSDLLGDVQQLESLLTAGNLKVMTGVLSETDIQIIRGLSSDIKTIKNSKGNITGVDGTYEGTVRKMKEIRQAIMSGANANGYYFDGQTITNPSTGERLVYSNGQWVSAQ